MNNLFSQPFGLRIRSDGPWHEDADPAYARNDVAIHDGMPWAAALTPMPDEEPGTGDSWVAWGGVTLSDALDGTGKAADGVGASSWALGELCRNLTTAKAWKLAADVPSFEDDEFIWVNNGDGTGVLTPKIDMLLRSIGQGGGGGGGGGYMAGSYAAAGGSGGQTVVKIVMLKAGVPVPITFGRGGAGGVGVITDTYISTAGSNGTSTIFGTYFIAAGGNSGFGRSTPSTGYMVEGPSVSSAVLQDSTMRTQAISPSAYVGHYADNGNYTSVNSGPGGTSPFGNAGGAVGVERWTLPAAVNGKDATGYGAGGSGGVVANPATGSQLTCNGGDGSPGCVYIERIA